MVDMYTLLNKIERKGNKIDYISVNSTWYREFVGSVSPNGESRGFTNLVFRGRELEVTIDIDDEHLLLVEYKSGMMCVLPHNGLGVAMAIKAGLG